MKAVVIEPLKENTLHIENVEIPEIKDDEVLVKVIRVGVCGTDKEINEGLYGEAPQGSKFLILGHESFGKIEKIGADVKDFKVGDMVVATVRRGDDCINCVAGESDMCLTGNYKERGIKGINGYMSEYYVEKPENLVHIPDSIKEEAVLLEPFTIAEKTVIQVFKIQQRMVWEPKTAIVFGTGPVGLLTSILLKLKGLNVYAVDRTEHIDDAKAEIFKRIGINHINSKQENVIDKFKGMQIDIIAEATGNPIVFNECLQLFGVNSVIALLSVTGGNFKTDIDVAKLNYDMVLNNKLIVGVVNANKSYFISGIKDMQEIRDKYGDILEKFITRRVKVSDFNNSDLQKANFELKTVVEFE